MDTLDNLVTEHLAKRLFTAERLTEILGSIAQRRAEKAAEVDRRIIALQREATEAEEKLRRLYRMVEEGLAEMDDLLRDRIASLRLDRERAHAALARATADVTSTATVSAEMVERFAWIMQERIFAGEIPFRKAYLQALIDRVEFDGHAIRIIGDKATMEQAIFRRAEDPAKAVRSSVRKWRARKDSNL